MSYIKNCDKCGQRISLRQMPNGQWVAFNANTDDLHEHGVKPKSKNYQKKSVTSEFARTNQSLDDDHIIDRVNEIHDLRNLSSEWLDLTPLNLKKLFNKLIDQEKTAHISYVDRDGDETSREIYPLSLVEGYASNRSKAKSLKIVSFCKLRNDYRTFLLTSIEEIMIGKKIPKSFRNQFASLSNAQKENILSGSNFYGSNTRYFESEELETPKKISKAPVEHKKIAKTIKEKIPEPEPDEDLTFFSESTYSDTSSSGGDWSTAFIWIAITLFAIFSCGNSGL